MGTAVHAAADVLCLMIVAPPCSVVSTFPSLVVVGLWKGAPRIVLPPGDIHCRGPRVASCLFLCVAVFA
jgi:hypothetical protein